MLDYLSTLGKNYADYFANANNFGQIVGNLGNLWGAYNQNKMAKKQFNLQKQAFDYNKMLSDREIERQNRADNELWEAYNNSSYAR